MIFLLDCSVAHFLESRGMLEEALQISTDPNYRFDLAMQLGNLEIAKVWCTFIVYPYTIKETSSKRFFPFHLHPQQLVALQEIAVEARSESKWKQLGELAMATGRVYFADIHILTAVIVLCNMLTILIIGEEKNMWWQT
jgi:coatomer subunit beta'